MKRQRRIRFTKAEKMVMWARWHKGDSLHAIAAGLGRGHTSVQSVLRRTGGIQPSERQRSARALTLSEREEISRGLCAGDSMRSIAAALGRSPSTISREIKRNGGRRRYRASTADRTAWDRARRPKRCKLALNRALARIVAKKLKALWAPEQIAGWLKHQYAHDESYQVSHETIYRTLFIQARGALKKELLQHLRRPRVMRRSRHHSQKAQGRGRISNAVTIRERPPSVEDRAVPGHWEGDLILGAAGNSQIATLVERHTRYVLLAKVNAKDTDTVVKALIKAARKLPRELRKSLTWDRGTELADHQSFTLATNIKVYFCDPHSPWQRGSNENTNGLLRQYFPKGTDLSVHSQAKLDAAARQLNERPRKTLGFRSPAEKFNECVASTG